MDFFDIRKLIEEVPDAQYYMVYGERSNGKTYSSLAYAIDNFVEKGEQFVYVRRLSESIRASYMRLLFNGMRKTGYLQKRMKTLGYDDISFYSGTFWPDLVNENGKHERVQLPIGYTMSINTWETAKGGSIPDATTIIFDEFLTRKYYLPNEPILFENLVSSVVRENANVKIIMLGNTVSWEAPYFAEWGLGHIRDQKQGTYNIYQSSEGTRKIVVCYTEHKTAKKSDIYFNFDDPRSKMIVSGTWETAIYPRIPESLEGWTKGEPCYIQTANGVCVKLEPAQTPDGMPVLLCWDNNNSLAFPTPPYVDTRYKDRIIYTDFFVPAANVRMAITKHSDKYTQFILSCFKQGRVFYVSNTVGEHVRNYLKFSTTYTPIAT